MYSKLVAWDAVNFMSIEKARAEFDEKGIINFKGYNDSGKSAMLMALKVLLTNSDPTKQADFIQDDKEYFRVIAYFDDGVAILRDKYINGQSLYEMYKDGEVLFSTKQGRVLTKVTGVPEPIADYLGLIVFNGVTLNARACFEKQIGVQTTGSENYEMFNVVLRSEEIASASGMINNDRNRLASDISALDSSLQTVKQMYKPGVTAEMVETLAGFDKSLEQTESMEADVLDAQETFGMVQSIVIPPELSKIEDMSDIVQVSGLSERIAEINILPELPVIGDTSNISSIARLSEALTSVVITPELREIGTVSDIKAISDMYEEYNSISVIPEIFGVAGFEDILSVVKAAKDVAEADAEIKNYDEQINENETLLHELSAKLVELGAKVVRCPGCGKVFTV